MSPAAIMSLPPFGQGGKGYGGQAQGQGTLPAGLEESLLAELLLGGSFPEGRSHMAPALLSSSPGGMPLLPPVPATHIRPGSNFTASRGLATASSGFSEPSSSASMGHDLSSHRRDTWPSPRGQGGTAPGRFSPMPGQGQGQGQGLPFDLSPPMAELDPLGLPAADVAQVLLGQGGPAPRMGVASGLQSSNAQLPESLRKRPLSDPAVEAQLLRAAKEQRLEGTAPGRALSAAGQPGTSDNALDALLDEMIQQTQTALHSSPLRTRGTQLHPAPAPTSGPAPDQSGATSALVAGLDPGMLGQLLQLQQQISRAPPQRLPAVQQILQGALQQQQQQQPPTVRSHADPRQGTTVHYTRNDTGRISIPSQRPAAASSSANAFRAEGQLAHGGSVGPDDTSDEELVGRRKGRVASERERRGKIRSGLQHLREEIDGQGDNATMLLDAVAYIRELKAEIESLKAQLPKREEGEATVEGEEGPSAEANSEDVVAVEEQHTAEEVHPEEGAGSRPAEEAVHQEHLTPECDQETVA